MPQLTAAQILAHPEFGKVAWEGQPNKQDSVDVAKGRGGPFKIAYEVHGRGNTKLVVSSAALSLSFHLFFSFKFVIVGLPFCRSHLLLSIYWLRGLFGLGWNESGYICF